MGKAESEPDKEYPSASATAQQPKALLGAKHSPKSKMWTLGKITPGDPTAEMPEIMEMSIWRSRERLNPTTVRPQETSWCESQPRGDLPVYTSLNVPCCFKLMWPAEEGTRWPFHTGAAVLSLYVLKSVKLVSSVLVSPLKPANAAC